MGFAVAQPILQTDLATPLGPGDQDVLRYFILVVALLLDPAAAAAASNWPNWSINLGRCRPPTQTLDGMFGSSFTLTDWPFRRRLLAPIPPWCGTIL